MNGIPCFTFQTKTDFIEGILEQLHDIDSFKNFV